MSMPDPMPSYDAQTPPATPPHPAPYAASAPEDAPLPGCGFARAVTRYWHGYVRFHGRASRGEYWWAVLFVAIVNVALNLLASLTDDAPLIGFLSFAWGAATILPSLAVSVRRLHDANGSGLFLLLPYGLILVGMLLAAAPMAQADESDLAVDVLDTLAVTDTQADVPGYDNNQSSGSFRFPEDVDDDAYGSKADMWDVIYMRDFDPATIKSDDGDVSYGVLRNDPYSGKDVTYEKGGASDIDIEHVVARSEAWDSGASEWTQAQRDAFANDPLEILAVSSGGNRAHGEKDAAGWLPSVGVKSTGVNNPAYDCLYVARQIAVKDKYDLSVDKDEKNAMSDVLATCPAQTIPDEQDGAYWENDTPSTGLAGDVNGDGEYTPSDLNGIQIVSDDGPLDLDTEWTTHRLDSLPANIRIEGLPDGWTSVPEDRSDPDRGYEILLLPVNDPTGNVVARYALLNAKAFDTADVNGNGRIDFDDLTGIRFIVDGEPYQQFDTDTLHYALPNGMEHTIRVENVPDVWEAIETPKSDGQGGESVSWAFIAPSRAEWVTYTFTWNTNTDTGDDTDTNVDDDTHTNAPNTPSDGGDTTETPTDQLASTGATITGIGAFTLAMLCYGAALGVLLRHRTRN